MASFLGLAIAASPAQDSLARDAAPKGKRAPAKGQQRPVDKPVRRSGRRLPPGLPPASDSSRPAARDVPPVPTSKARPVPPALLGWGADLATPDLEDRRRRLPATRRPDDIGQTLRPGERFRFDVSFSGNPAGLAEASILNYEPDPRGPPPAGARLIRMEGHARTSGVLSLLATVTDDIESVLDARTGAPVHSVNVIKKNGLGANYRKRVTVTAHEGRGRIRIEDDKDGKKRRKNARVPVDTFDPMSAMAWVRSLDLEDGERAKAHAMDATMLLRVEITGRGNRPPAELPSIATALGIGPEDVRMVTGLLTPVDAYDQKLPGKRVFKLKAWISDDGRGIPLALESDMWVGAIRLVLTHYDPPYEDRLGPS